VLERVFGIAEIHWEPLRSMINFVFLVVAWVATLVLGFDGIGEMHEELEHVHVDEGYNTE
jgi:hypothetical protein